jgi:DNA modification methylase
VNPYYQDAWLTVYGGDCREVLRSLEPESVHCVVTSPPYWGLRDYGTATWDGGDADCSHRIAATGSTQNKGNNNREGAPFRERCERCGAIRLDSQLGLEPTPEEYVANLVDVFREVRRVLRADGTVWLNLGDSFNAYNGNRGESQSISRGRGHPEHGRGLQAAGLKPKDLVGIPWRVAFALQADGWYLRSDIIWAKPNPMPESVTDRPTKAHEYLFLLSKSPRYYYDADAVAEPLTETSIERLSQPGLAEQTGSNRVPGKTNGNMKAVGRLAEAWVDAGGTLELVPPEPPRGNPTWEERKAAGAMTGSKVIGHNASHGAGLSHDLGRGGSRNLRSVWTIATQPYPGAHFATFPRKLVEPCVKAGTSERGVCPECGAPWERQVRRAPNPSKWAAGEDLSGGAFDDRTSNPQSSKSMHRNGSDVQGPPPVTTGWDPGCEGHYPSDFWDGPIPATVLDPFAGSGTTGMVAQALNRRAILIDLNGDYLVQAMNRNRDIPLGLGA